MRISLCYAIVVKHSHHRGNSCQAAGHRARRQPSKRKTSRSRSGLEAIEKKITHRQPQGYEPVKKPKGSETYVCSTCGFRSDLEGPDWFDPSVPVWNWRGKKRQGCLSLCPKAEGPDDAYLTSPDGLQMRYRVTFESEGREVRACTPIAVLHRNSEGGCSIGPVMGLGQMFREIKLREYLKAHVSDTKIDLHRLANASLMIAGDLYCYRLEDTWLLALRGHIPRDSWERKSAKLLRSEQYKKLSHSLRDLVTKLEPRLSGRIEWNQVLHVPIDMTRPIEKQLNKIRPQLVEAQEYLYRYTRKAPSRDKTGTTWRNIYIYLLATVASRSPKSIAEEVFPNEDWRSRQLKVNEIVRAVSNAAATVGLQFHPQMKEIDPPA